jgi:hypothetical protein
VLAGMSLKGKYIYFSKKAQEQVNFAINDEISFQFNPTNIAINTVLSNLVVRLKQGLGFIEINRAMDSEILTALIALPSTKEETKRLLYKPYDLVCSRSKPTTNHYHTRMEKIYYSFALNDKDVTETPILKKNPFDNFEDILGDYYVYWKELL